MLESNLSCTWLSLSVGDFLYKKRNRHEIEDEEEVENDPMEELNADDDLGVRDENEGISNEIMSL